MSEQDSPWPGSHALKDSTGHTQKAYHPFKEHTDNLPTSKSCAQPGHSITQDSKLDSQQSMHQLGGLTQFTWPLWAFLSFLIYVMGLIIPSLSISQVCCEDAHKTTYSKRQGTEKCQETHKISNVLHYALCPAVSSQSTLHLSRWRSLLMLWACS